MTSKSEMRRIAAMLIGRTIKDIDPHPWGDANDGGPAYDPHILLDDGAVLSFHVQETEIGDYGVVLRVGRRAWTKVRP